MRRKDEMEKLHLVKFSRTVNGKKVKEAYWEQYCKFCKRFYQLSARYWSKKNFKKWMQDHFEKHEKESFLQ